MSRSLCAIIIDPAARTVEQRRIDPTLETLQQLVGGYIEIVPVACLGEDVLYCNEEGKMRPNSHFALRTREHDPFAGTCVILGPGDEEGDDTETTWTAEEVAEFVTWLPQYDGVQVLA